MHFSRYTRWNSPIGWSVAAVAAFSALIFPRATTWCWVAFFLIAATLCGSVYRERCGRVHCRITAPLFLLCACYLTLVELDRVPSSAMRGLWRWWRVRSCSHSSPR
jgi:hypothetical protein